MCGISKESLLGAGRESTPVASDGPRCEPRS